MSLISARFKRLFRLGLWVVGSVIVLGTLSLAALFLRSDIYSFRPRLPRITAMIETQRLATPALPPLLSRFLDVDAPYSTPDQFMAKRLLDDYGLLERAIFWHRIARVYFWSWSLVWHLTLEERHLLHCAFLNDGDGHQGVHHLNHKLHGKELDQLSDIEIAELVVASRAPMRYLRDREILKQHAQALLQSAGP